LSLSFALYQELLRIAVALHDLLPPAHQSPRGKKKPCRLDVVDATDMVVVRDTHVRAGRSYAVMRVHPRRLRLWVLASVVRLHPDTLCQVLGEQGKALVKAKVRLSARQLYCRICFGCAMAIVWPEEMPLDLAQVYMPLEVAAFSCLHRHADNSHLALGICALQRAI